VTWSGHRREHAPRALEDDPKHPRLLKTVRGAGYVLADDEEDP